MPSRAEQPAAPAAARLLEELLARLEAGFQLSETARAAIARADARTIEDSQARVETLVAEVKLLAEECRRLMPGPGAAQADPHTARAHANLVAAATRLARSSAIAGGLLERMVALRTAVLASATAEAGGAYLPSGRTPEFSSSAALLSEDA